MPSKIHTKFRGVIVSYEPRNLDVSRRKAKFLSQEENALVSSIFFIERVMDCTANWGNFGALQDIYLKNAYKQILHYQAAQHHREMVKIAYINTVPTYTCLLFIH